jgi:hypothetical protein
MKGILLLMTTILISSGQLIAQTTFERVKVIFNNNCVTGCHSGTDPFAQLSLDGSTAQVYAELTGVAPLNPAAVSAGMKLVDPGYPERSFLFAKVSSDIDPVAHLVQPNMGTPMPQNQAPLAYRDIELVRQWILFGADTVSDYVDPQLLEDFYAGEGMARITPLDAPDPSEGFQIHYGPFFLAPLQEEEYFYKYNTRLPETVEVNRIETFINEESHHTALYRYFPEADTNFLPGLRPVTNVLVAAGVYYTSDIIGQWPNSQDLVLPEGTAFRFSEGVVVDLNYHIPNYSPDSILAAEFYMNVYTQPEGTAQQEMISAPMYYGGADPTALTVPGNTTDSVYAFATFETDTSYTWYIWSMMAHTHQLAQDYQVFKRNPNGTKGENIYNGHYDATYSFDQGYYDWQHPPFRTFDDELLEVDFSEGLIHEATYSNPNSETVLFGLQTTDEMFVTYIQYVEEPLTIGVEEYDGNEPNPLKIYPNPSAGTFNLSFESTASGVAEVLLYNEVGQEVYRTSSNFGVGKQRMTLDRASIQLQEGVYFIRISSDSMSMSSKVVLF